MQREQIWEPDLAKKLSNFYRGDLAGYESGTLKTLTLFIQSETVATLTSGYILKLSPKISFWRLIKHLKPNKCIQGWISKNDLIRHLNRAPFEWALSSVLRVLKSISSCRSWSLEYICSNRPRQMSSHF